MNKNKGVIGIGLIIAIVLGVAVVGGGAYYLGKGSNQEVNEIPEVSEINKEVGQEVSKTQEQGTKVVEQTKTVVDNSSANCTPNSVPSIKVISPNGGEVYKAGEKITVKWESCNFRSNAKGVNISVAWVGNLEALSFPVASGTPNDGQEVITLPSLKEIKDFYTNTFVVNIQMNIAGQNLTVNGDGSDNSFTINSSESSSTENFKNQPGKISRLTPELGIRWVLSVDLLSNNPKWLPGVDSTGGPFINQNTKTRNLIATRDTKMYNCGNGPDGNPTTPDVLADPDTFIEKIIKDDYKKIKYFDINGTNITAMYEQCLP